MRLQRTLGVIGHVDHGKTALVRALTGIETDRLEEERQRGLSIVLGFAHLELERGVVDFIDVPGHEDFVRTMISGATGIDGVLLVVAANESVMPQTREHLAIAQLLHIDRGLVVLTKADLVSRDELALAEQRVRELVAGSSLAAAPVVCVSALSGDGIDALKAALATLLVPQADSEALADGFLPIDRVFAMPGFGVVVTGTLRHGRLQENQSVEVLPKRQPATIRALQNHRQPIRIAYPGQRVAVNLRGVGRDELARGDVVASSGFLTPTRRLDVELELHADCPSALENGTAVRLLLGTSEVVARVRLLGHGVLQPGAKGFAQLRCDADVVTHRNERFIVRSISPVATLGGGRVLAVDAARRSRLDAGALAQLERAAVTDAQAAFEAHLDAAGAAGASIAGLGQALSLSAEAVTAAADRASAVRIGDAHVIARTRYAALQAAIVTALQRFHAANPKNPGLAAAALAAELSDAVDPKVLRQAVAELVAAGALVTEGGLLRRPDFDPLGGLPAGERAIAAEIEQRFRAGGLDPPDVHALIDKDRTKQQLFKMLLDTGTLVRLKTYDRKSNVVLHRDVLSAVERRLHAQFPYPREFTVANVRDLFDATRKSIVPLLEHLDSTGATVRDGNVRRLRAR